MDMHRFVFSSGTLVLAALFAASPLSFAAEASGARTTAKDISRKADDTARAVKNYTVQQRDEAIKSAKSALDDLDARLRSLDRKVDREWDKMDQAARKKARTAQGALRRERDDVAEWYGGLKHGSAESWEEVKDGFVKSYEALKKSFVKTRKEL
ncbi:MAG TPA: hypothetical protein VFI80_06520 [Burkholderiales bacterium]|nr:hypothetical protein [Burkholderiales bacterium]